MRTITSSRLGLWAGEVLLEYCPYEKPKCEWRGCWPAALCRAARSKQNESLWKGLAAERRRERIVWAILGCGSLGMVILAFVWPYLHV